MLLPLHYFRSRDKDKIKKSMARKTRRDSTTRLASESHGQVCEIKSEDEENHPSAFLESG